jgi:hypothetical protein
MSLFQMSQYCGIEFDSSPCYETINTMDKIYQREVIRIRYIEEQQTTQWTKDTKGR